VNQALINPIHGEAGMNANPHIPDYWSPEQALAVYELLDALREQVWDRYGEQITERMRREYAEQQARAQLELPFNDEIPF
jgi:hypothetical protein